MLDIQAIREKARQEPGPFRSWVAELTRAAGIIFLTYFAYAWLAMMAAHK